MNLNLIKKIFQEIFLWSLAGVAAVFLLYNLFPPLFAATIVGDGVLIYSTSTSAGLVHYRTYASSTNAFADPPSIAITLPGDTVGYILSADSPTSTEKITVIQDDIGATGIRLTALRWNGASWINDWQESSTASSTIGNYRHFGVAYYGNSGNAMVVYATSTSHSMAYKTWNGSSWSATSTFALATGGSIAAVEPQWIELAGPPTATSSGRLAMAYSDGNSQIGYAIWSGSSWGVASSTARVPRGLTNNWRGFDVAIENSSGDILVVYGKEATQGIFGTSCVNGCSSWNNATRAGSANTADAEFIDAAPSPQSNSNDIAIVSCAVATPDDSFVGYMWTGAGFISNTETDNASDCDAGTVTTNFPAAVGWIGTSDVAFAVYPDTTGGGIKAGQLDFATCDTGCTDWALQSAITGLNCLAATLKSSISIQTWPNNAQAMVTTVATNGKICESIKNSGLTAWTSSGQEMGDATSVNGMGAWFSFNNVVSPTFGQRDFRWYVNSSTSTQPNGPWPNGASPLAENASITSSDTPPETNDIVRLRISATSTDATIAAGTSLTVQFQATASTDCTSGSWTDVGSATTWALVDNAGVTDGTTLTSLLTASNVNENYNESNPSLGMPSPISIGQKGEFDWPIKNNGAAGGTTYSFRLAQSDGTAFTSYNNCPQITTSGVAGPTVEQVLRHGAWFNAGVEQSFFWAK